MPQPTFERKLCPPGELAERVAQPAAPAGIHQRLLRHPASRPCDLSGGGVRAGASLIVGVNSDDSVRRQGKGDDRPINRLEDRMALLAALESVSLVVGFDTDTPFDLILAIRPRCAGERGRLEHREHRWPRKKSWDGVAVCTRSRFSITLPPLRCSAKSAHDASINDRPFMIYRDLRDFIAQLEKMGELKRIAVEVDPKLEMTEIADRVLRAGGPALLFENPKAIACRFWQICSAR